jgi:hypothetical protein
MTPSPQPEEPELPFFVPDDADTSDFELPKIMCRCGKRPDECDTEHSKTLFDLAPGFRIP